MATKHSRTLSSIVASSSGETWVETLVSVLISSLALLMLATAIGTSVNIVMSSRDRMEEFYGGESEMIKGAQGSSEGSSMDISLDVALTRDDEGDLNNTESVESYKSTDSKSGVTFYERSTP